MSRIDTAIELIIPDNTAFTVLTALRQLGYAQLARVYRSEHLVLDVAENADAEQIVERLSRTEVVFNPNKHRLSFSVDGETKNATPVEFEAHVRDKDENNQHLLTLLRGTFGMTQLRDLVRAVGWRLREESGTSSRERLEWACQTLLANPISQYYDIRQRPVRRFIRETMANAANTAQ